ncbi:hypothetical protein ACFYZJ_18075 [Streptomyces sp. NPDC001848]
MFKQQTPELERITKAFRDRESDRVSLDVGDITGGGTIGQALQ